VALKKVNNADTGDADHWGGNDQDNFTTAIDLGEPYDYSLIAVSTTYYLKNSTGEISTSGTDAGALINTAITAIGANGGMIFLGEGTFNVSTTITLPSLIKIIGSGYNTIIKLANGVNVDIFKSTNFATLTGTNGTGGIHSFILRDFVIDGNSANNTSACYGIRVYGYGYLIDNIIVHHCKNDNIYSEWSTSTAGPSPYSMEAELRTIKSYSAGGRNITFRGPHDSRWFDVITFRAGTQSVAVESLGSTYSGSCEMTGCHYWGNTDHTKDTLVIDGANVTAHGVIAEGSDGVGGIGIHTLNGGAILGKINVFANETGVLLHSQNNDINVLSTGNTNGVVVDAAYNRITGFIQSNTGIGLNLSNYAVLSDITIDVHMRLNATHINWALAHTGVSLKAHIITATTEVAMTGTPNLATNELRIYSTGAGSNYNNIAGMSPIGLVTQFPQIVPTLANKKYGAYVGLGTTQSTGILGANGTAIAVGTGASGGISRVSGAGLGWRHTTGATINSIGGARFNSNLFTQRDFNPWAQIRMRINQTANTRCFWGFTSSNAAPTSGADQLNALSGVMFGYDSGVDGNWHIYQNNGTGASDSTTIANVAAAGTGIHTFALRADEANTKFQYSYDGGAWADINTDIPASSTGMGLIFQIENLTGSAMTMDVYYMEIIQDI